MISPVEKAKIARFLDDTVLADTVREVIECSIIKKRGDRDVYHLAAERIALDILREAWEDLRKYKSEVENERGEKQINIGV